jgi:hypothetical protein
VIHRDRVYTIQKTLSCLDLATGKRLWRGGSFGHGSCLVTADDKLVVFGNGRLTLLEARPRPDRYTELSRTDRLVSGTCYPHVALAGGLLVAKDRDGQMAVLSVRGDGRGAPVAAARPDLHDAPAPKMAAVWPGNGEALQFVRGGAADRVAGADGKTARACAVKARGKARVAEDGAMHFTGGGLLAVGADAPLLAACRASNRFAVEVVLTPADVKQIGPARIVSFSSDPYERNFTLGQQKDRLVLRLRTPRTGENGMRPEVTLCRVTAGRPHHVVVSYSPGRMTCSLNGKRVLDTDRVGGDFGNWSPQHLLFGDEWKGVRPWAGALGKVAIHSRVIGAEEAAARCALAKEK